MEQRCLPHAAPSMRPRSPLRLHINSAQLKGLAFIDISDTQDEAACYRDVGDSGAVAGPEREHFITPWYSKFRLRISRRLVLTNYLIEFFERNLVRLGQYHLSVGQGGNLFDLERSAWTYRKVSETDAFDAGYAPLGVEGGIAKEMAKMTLLWQELAGGISPSASLPTPGRRRSCTTPQTPGRCVSVATSARASASASSPCFLPSLA